MSLRSLVTTLAVLALLAPSLRSQDNVEFFPVDQIRPGLKGVGRTVFEGDKIEEFQVEFLGVLHNVMSPKHDVILARLSGDRLERTGVMAGMSGSPVYVDGKLVGAVALAFPFAKEPLTGITPIGEMVQVIPEAAPAQQPGSGWAMRREISIARIPGSHGAVRLIPDEASDSAALKDLLPASGGDATLAGLRLPLRFGGFAPQAIEAYAPLFRRLGFEPMEGAALSGGPSDEPIKQDLEPGSMISLLLVRGDLNVNVDCTVTYRQGDSVYACGHRFLLAGPAKFPFAQSRVVATVPSLASSFKLSSPGPVVGSIQQDRYGAIYGVLGDTAPQIPVRIRVDSSLNRTEEYKFDIVEEPFLTPLMMNVAMITTLAATERMIGPSTVEMKGQIRLANGESVDVEDVVSSNLNTPTAATAAVSAPLTYLLGTAFPDLRIEGIDLEIVSRSEKREATIEQVWSSKSEVRPGEKIEVTVVLRTPSGEALVKKIPVEIPESVSDKALSLVVGSGSTINSLQRRLSPLTTTPRDLSQMVRALNRMRRNNRLYALLMAPQRSFLLQGDEYPSPPPSLVQTFLADPSVSSRVVMSGTSVVGDFETDPSPYTIRGQETLLLKVSSPGN
jgi:SpoIVB peptidase S55